MAAYSEASKIPVASEGLFGICDQATGATADGKGSPRTALTDNASFKYFMFTSAPYGLVQPVGQLPAMAGGVLVPQGTYKTGIWGAGALNLVPFLADDVGALLAAAMGKDTVASNVIFDPAAPGTPVAPTAGTSAIHTFTLGAKQSDLPYFTLRKFIQAGSLGELTTDARLANLELSLPAAGIMSMMVDFQGRVPDNSDVFFTDPFSAEADDSATGKGQWNGAVATAVTTHDPGYDSPTTYPLASDPNSFISIGGVKLPVQSVVLTLNNTLLQPDRARIIGSQTIVDSPVMARNAQIRVTMMMTDADLYRQIFTGTTTGRKYSAAQYSGNIDFLTYSAQALTGVTHATLPTAYGIRVFTTDSNIEWQLQGALAQQAGDAMFIQLTGVVRKNATGNWLNIQLQNANTAKYGLA